MTNEEISLNTKRMLSNALKRKMRRKAFSKITVTEIVAECNINHNTFYYHFDDMYALLKWTFEQDTINVLKSMDLLSNVKEALRFILDYADNNKFIINCAYDSLGKEQLKQFFYTDLESLVVSSLNELEKSSRVPMSDKEKKLFSMFFTEGVTGLLLNYVRDSKAWSKEDIIRITDHLFTRLKIFITE